MTSISPRDTYSARSKLFICYSSLY